jgi:hypothetical protein
MATDPEYGTTTKRVVFTDTDHRHAQLLIRLRHDGLTQAEFFRSLISGYIENDERIQSYMEEISTHSKKKKNSSRKLRTAGKKAKESLGLSSNDVEDLFDMIAEEHPDL